MEDASSRDQVGLGIDVVEICRVAAVLARTPRFVERVYTAQERAYCDATSNPQAHFATRWAAKEAVCKALGTGFLYGISPFDIEVRRSAKGRPFAVLSGAARARAEEIRLEELPISLSYTHTEAVACAMAITADSRAAADARIDPTEELARRFKEARELLDSLDVGGRSDDDSISRL